MSICPERMKDEWYQLYAFLVCTHYLDGEMCKQWWTYCVYPSAERNLWGGGPKS